VDESGDRSLTSINPDYPVFVLSFCIFTKACYADTLTPAVRRLKFDIPLGAAACRPDGAPDRVVRDQAASGQSGV
jgi:hypothetical protein